MMSRNVIVILIYNRYKPTDLNYIHCCSGRMVDLSSFIYTKEQNYVISS
jgi:hypothetical protein